MSLRQVFFAIFVVSVVMAVLRLHYVRYLRNLTIAKCEANSEVVPRQAGLPAFRLVTSRHFDAVNGERYEALIFESLLIMIPQELVVKVVVVDRNYSVLQSEVVATMNRKYLTGECDLVYCSEGAVVKIEISGDFMDTSRIQMPVLVSPDCVQILSCGPVNVLDCGRTRVLVESKYSNDD